MGNLVGDGTEFSCPFCTGKLALKVPSSSTTGDSKKIANKGNCFFPPPGGNCIVIPSAPVPCTPAAVVTDPGQSPVTVDGMPALGEGCKFQCAKGGLLTVSSPTQTIAKHDGAASAAKAVVDAVAVSAAFASTPPPKDKPEEEKKEEQKKEK